MAGAGETAFRATNTPNAKTSLKKKGNSHYLQILYLQRNPRCEARATERSGVKRSEAERSGAKRSEAERSEADRNISDILAEYLKRIRNISKPLQYMPK